ncbi:MAG: 2-oxo acid dehydrogenase subunit E2 [Candidatus Marinimicrobia bacterium]|nr:2-oxo acid dehydrogenase subunit E2 [Candidatus Neomarinimicrobiota bacterium]MCH8068968.1 2-oxo acid dehydrogenase subunit E2 [Candidatus Neomarinimicrobiota bacterium]
MVVEVIMPRLGESITEGIIIEWRKKVGDTIEKDEILLEIGTDKVDSEIPSAVAGVITEILAQPNDVVPVETVIAKVETEIDIVSIDAKTKAPPLKGDGEVERISSQQPEPKSELQIPTEDIPILSIAKPEAKRKFYTPLVRSIALKEGITESQLMTINGTGKDGRVTKRDILAYLDQLRKPSTEVFITEEPFPELVRVGVSTEQPFVLTGKRTEMDRMRQIIATHMRKSLDTAAHVHLVSECDMTRIVKYRDMKQEEFKKREGYKLTYTPFFVIAATKTIHDFPLFNASLEGKIIVQNKNINIGLAVSLDKGLMVPVIRNCEELNFLGICRKVRDLTVRVRSGKLSPEELQGSTFTITNYGVFGNLYGTPIINQPNVAILGIGAITKRPVVRETEHGDAIIIRSMCYITLGFDHRLIDGASGGKFLQRLVQHLENIDFEALF